MNNKNIYYFTYEDVLDVYARTIDKSGGGFIGVRDEGGIKLDRKSTRLNPVTRQSRMPSSA